MRSKLALVVVALAALCLIGPPAGAFDFAIGENLGKLADWGSFFREIEDGDTLAEPLAVGDFDIGDWDQTLFRITQLFEPPVEIPANQYYSGLNPELVGLAYDLEIVNIEQLQDGSGNPINTFQIDLGSAGRFDEVYSQDLGGGITTIGRVDIWEDAANNLNPNPTNGADPIGPANWGYGAPGGAGWSVNPFDAGEYDTFPTATDGTAIPILSGTFVPYDPTNKPGVAITLTLDFDDGTGNATQGFILLTYVNGAAVNHPIGDWVVQTTGDGLPYHVSFVNRFSFYPNDVFSSFETASNPFDDPTTEPIWWATESQDPIRFTIVPEPATVSLLGIALLGMAGGLFRRKKEA